MSPSPKDIAGFQRLDEIGARAWTDDDYRRRLLDDPKSVLREGGLEIPDDVEVVIHRNRPKLVHLVMPAEPVDTDQLNVNEVRVAMLHCHAF